MVSAGAGARHERALLRRADRAGPGATGTGDEADEILARLEEESRQHYVRSEIMAMGYAAVGDVDRAFACLERAFQVRSAGLIYVHVDPGYMPLHPDPRFRQLVERIGLTIP